MSFNPRILTITDLDEAREELARIGVDKSGINIMALKSIHLALKISGVDARAANIIKQEMLARGGEAALARGVYDLKSKETDVILMGTFLQYESFLKKLTDQPFGLKSLADEISRILEKTKQTTSTISWKNYTLEFGKRTLIMGVLNVTPDSFADGDRFNSPDKAVSHALQMAEDGADIIDVGGESSRPGAEAVDTEKELERVIPVIERLAEKIKIPISIDTYKSEVAKKAIEAGASMVNDISGLRTDKNMVGLVSEYGVPVIIMHMKGTPRDMQDNPHYKSLIDEISQFLNRRAEFAQNNGIKCEHIIIDPGIGFGKTVDHNLLILKRLAEFKSLGYPVLVGTSRKSFIGQTLDIPVQERLEGTAATVAYSIAQGADIVRVHDVKEMVQVARMTDAITKADHHDDQK